jgi:hypothetical protein
MGSGLDFGRKPTRAVRITLKFHKYECQWKNINFLVTKAIVG